MINHHLINDSPPHTHTDPHTYTHARHQHPCAHDEHTQTPPLTHIRRLHPSHHRRRARATMVKSTMLPDTEHSHTLTFTPLTSLTNGGNSGLGGMETWPNTRAAWQTQAIESRQHRRPNRPNNNHFQVSAGEKIMTTHRTMSSGNNMEGCEKHVGTSTDVCECARVGETDTDSEKRGGADEREIRVLCTNCVGCP